MHELRDVLDKIFKGNTTEQWMTTLATSGVPHAPIFDVAGAFSQAQIRDGDFLGMMSTPTGETRAMRTPLVIDGVRPPIRSGPRGLGQDTGDVFER
jgi:crotonobetainyl-CoA:carnitine CoA-transferase CaiB-like acyl-CoA transferase